MRSSISPAAHRLARSGRSTDERPDAVHRHLRPTSRERPSTLWERARARRHLHDNNPYEGGTHICDAYLVAPIFSDAHLVAFAVSITHWIEIGGAVPGSIPVDATEIFQEGLLFPCIRLCRRGMPMRSCASFIPANVRLPRLALGDLDAGTAAVRIGERRVREACARYGAEALLEAMRDILERGERMSRDELANEYPFTARADAASLQGYGRRPWGMAGSTRRAVP